MPLPESGDVMMIAAALLMVHRLYNRWEQEIRGERPRTNVSRTSEDADRYLAAYGEYLREARQTADLLGQTRGEEGRPERRDAVERQRARQDEAYARYQQAARRLMGEPEHEAEADRGVRKRSDSAHARVGMGAPSQ